MKQNINKKPMSSIFNKPNLKAPQKFEDFSKDMNQLWIGDDINAGLLSLMIIKPFSEGPYNRSSIIHQIQFLPKEQQQMVQAAYQYMIIADHRTKTGKASCVFDTRSKSIRSGSLENKFFDKKVHLDLNFSVSFFF